MTTGDGRVYPGERHPEAPRSLQRGEGSGAEDTDAGYLRPITLEDDAREIPLSA